MSASTRPVTLRTFAAGHTSDATSEIDPDSFRLTRVSGAYWRGNQQREQMQRVYGVAFDTKKELEDYFVRLEEAKKRDHRKLGRELGLFMFHQWAPGDRVLAAQGDDALQHARRIYARGALSGRVMWK